ncbi:MAG: serine/threonine protein kinase [Candidatus Dormibacteraeota bacterium]|nr:serine/threonine protein kinase [Candidatus Dormibacteraeota bacterium]
MAIQPGSTLDGFTVLDAIGHGAFSDVYLAEDPSGRKVVLKCPHDAILGDTSSFDRFRREMEIARKLDHPGIQRSYDLQQDRTRPYLVMEYVEGESLRELLHREKKLPTARAIDIVEKLAEAMGYAHSMGVYHRDLKPENILVTPDQRVVVTDFGIALMTGARRLTWRFLTSAVGTPDYMAPEQIQGKRGDARTDVYAMGIILFEMLTGHVPWEGDNPLAVMSQHINAPVPSLQHLNRDVLPPLEAVVRKSLRKDPEERYQGAGDLLHDLKHWQDLDLSEFVFTDEQPMRQDSERWVWIAVVLLSVGFLAVTALATYLYYLLNHAGHH